MEPRADCVYAHQRQLHRGGSHQQMLSGGGKRQELLPAHRGYVDQYFIENHHAPLVSREVFQVVQQLVVGRLLVTGRRKELSDSEVFLLARAGVLAGREFGKEAV